MLRWIESQLYGMPVTVGVPDQPPREVEVERVVYRDRIVEGRAYAEQVWRHLVALADNAYPPGGWISYGSLEQAQAQAQALSMGHYEAQMRRVADDFYTAMAWPWFEEEQVHERGDDGSIAG